MRPRHAQPAEDVLRELGARQDDGLSDVEVRSRRARFGPNALARHRPRSAWSILLAQFRSLIVALLLGALALSALTRDWLEAIAIGVVIAVNAAIGFASELRAVRSMEALRRLGGTLATVRRAGIVQRIAAEELVPGDIVLLEAGDVVAADLRLLEASRLLADESLLTGESTPVEKDTPALDPDAPLADRTNMLFRGTAVTRGSAHGVVCATGMQTELGRITALMAESVDEGLTPLELRLARLGRSLVWLTGGVAAVVALSGLVAGRDAYLSVKTAIALAVAAVPEGLPIVATLALARGMWRMVQRNVLVNRLAAVETLGATTVIFADKTGTLTENRMTVRRVETSAGGVEIGGGPFDEKGDLRHDEAPGDDGGDAELRALLEVGVLCNNASWGRGGDPGERTPVGDPMEVALLVAGEKAGVGHEAVRAAHAEVAEIAFDPAIGMMATVHRANGALRVAVKGAPEAVLDACTSERRGGGSAPLDAARRDAWRARCEALADAGLRVLAFAERSSEREPENPFAGLTLLGLAGLVDPPRKDVRAAVDECRGAGVRIVIVTGDHAATARYVARAVGLEGDGEIVTGAELAKTLQSGSADAGRRLLRAPIFARVSPEQKLDLIRLYQEHGHVVAMTGDGVNDAPALKAADIGVAMGRRGTDVAREAADMILRDDAFGSIPAAIGQGRVIFDNIRTFIRYLVSCNLSEIVVVLLGVLAQTPLPILPLQILFLNLVTDVFPALALGVGEGDRLVMQRPPRDPREPVLARRHWAGIAGYGALMAVSVLGALLIALELLGLDQRRAVTVSFLTLAFAQLWHVFDMRAPGSGTFVNQITRNRFVWLALAACTGLIVAAVHVPLLAVPLRTADPGRDGWLLIAAMSVLPALVGQLTLLLRRGRRGARAAYQQMPS